MPPCEWMILYGYSTHVFASNHTKCGLYRISDNFQVVRLSYSCPTLVRSRISDAWAQALVPQWVLRPFWAHDTNARNRAHDMSSVNLASVRQRLSSALLPADRLSVTLSICRRSWSIDASTLHRLSLNNWTHVHTIILLTNVSSRAHNRAPTNQSSNSSIFYFEIADTSSDTSICVQ